MIHKLEHIGVQVKNMDDSVSFYSGVLNLKLVERVRANDKVELAFLAYPGTENIVIELIAGNDKDFASEGVVHHIAFTVADIESEIERLKQLGVKLIDETPRVILGGVKIAFFYGPDNEQLEFFQSKA